MGKIILVLVILFAGYWGLKYHNKTKEAPEKKPYKPGDKVADADSLKAYYEQKIAEIESKSIEEIEKAQESLDKYKAELDKLNQLKNK